MPDPLITPSFLFRFSVPCLYQAASGSAPGDMLGEEYRLPHFGQLDGRRTIADVRAAWSEQGVMLQVRVESKTQVPWCRESRLEDSDGLCVWIDTRDTHNIHRATRFCHRFMFLPSGGGRRLDQPVADQLIVARARENAKPIRPDVLKVQSEKRVDGYIMQCFIPTEAMTGYDPNEHPKLGFMYGVFDRELGIQTLSSGTEMPFDADPSLWATLELVRD